MHWYNLEYGSLVWIDGLKTDNRGRLWRWSICPITCAYARSSKKTDTAALSSIQRTLSDTEYYRGYQHHVQTSGRTLALGNSQKSEAKTTTTTTTRVRGQRLAKGWGTCSYGGYLAKKTILRIAEYAVLRARTDPYPKTNQKSNLHWDHVSLARCTEVCSESVLHKQPSIKSSH